MAVATGGLVWMDMLLLGAALSSALAVAIALVCSVRLRRQAQLTQQLYRRLSGDLQAANSSAIGMGQRLLAMERQLKSALRQNAGIQQNTEIQHNGIQQRNGVGQKVAALQPPPLQESPEQGQLEAPFSYSQALSLFDTGVCAAEVARICGLSQGEASLMEVMHRHVQGEAVTAPA